MAEETMEELVTESAPVITTRKLLEAGVHFGHKTGRWNPKMKKYIYTSRNGIYIIDLEKSANLIETAYNALKKIAEDGGKVLFVGTKRTSQEIIREEALRSGSFYVTNRWLGGTMTNFKTLQRSIRRLKDIEKMEEDGTFEVLPKIEVISLKKEAERLEKNLGGLKEMRKVPNAIFVVDSRVDHNAVLEARKLNIPVFGIADTNSDPDDLDYVIPGNDDASKSVKLLVSVMADAIVEARGGETVVAYTPDVEGDVSMNDALTQENKTEETKTVTE